MSTHDSDVIGALRDSLDDVTMPTPVERIVAAGRARRRRHRLTAATGVAAVAAAGIAVGVPVLDHRPTAPTLSVGGVHIGTAAFTLDTYTDGTIHVTWSKADYFRDPEGLQRALRQAGFPVLVKTGVFCRGPHDDPSLTPSGGGPGVDRVMKGERQGGKVILVFNRSAIPAGKQLFIGYLSLSQLAAVHGNPGSVERIVPASGPLTCTTQAPPPHRYGNAARH